MKRASGFVLVPVMGLALAALACNTLNSRVPWAAQPTPAPTPTPAPEAAAPVGRPLPIAGGPVIGSPRETRIAVSENVASVQSLAPENYTTEELAVVGKTFTYTVAMDESRELLWIYGWCTTSLELLGQNLEHMQVDFFVNGTRVDPQQLQPFYGQASDGMPCQYLVTVVYDWPSGSTRLETVVTFKEKINDGISDYPPGTQTLQYTVTVP
jgi:hypothetical protein